jgi:putative endonuclease
MNNIEFGQRGEDLAVEFLQEEGYEILERNWRCKRVEVDIIAKFHEFLIIVEVKTRKGNSYGEPYTAVDFRKQRALIFAAERYIFSHHMDMEVRFDILSIILDMDELDLTENTEPQQNMRVAIEHIKDAFRAIAR